MKGSIKRETQLIASKISKSFFFLFGFKPIEDFTESLIITYKDMRINYTVLD